MNTHICLCNKLSLIPAKAREVFCFCLILCRVWSVSRLSICLLQHRQAGRLYDMVQLRLCCFLHKLTPNLSGFPGL